jgi:uncharacterized protein (DUF305 family)
MGAEFKEASMRYAFIPLLAVALGVAVAGCVRSTLAATQNQPIAAPTGGPTPSPREVDRSFVTAMVIHHAAAVQMAQVEVQRGQRADVKHLAQDIINTQEYEIAQLQQVAQQDFGFTPSTTLPTASQQGVLMGQPILMNFPQQIDALKTATDPDMMFLQMMIPHHAMAIVQADTQMMYGDNHRLKAISQNIVSSQSQQIGVMEHTLQHP